MLLASLGSRVRLKGRARDTGKEREREREREEKQAGTFCVGRQALKQQKEKGTCSRLASCSLAECSAVAFTCWL